MWTNPILLIILGTILFALEGLLATLGWSLRASQETRETLRYAQEAELESRREAILRTLAGEFIVNSKIAKSKELTESDQKELSKFVWLPRFQTVGLSVALTSGLFLEEKDKTFISELHHYWGPTT